MPDAGVGRISVRVTPDTKGFTETLKAFLHRIESSLTLNVRVQLDSKQMSGQFKKTRDESQKQADRDPVSVPVQLGDVEAASRQRMKRDVAAAVKGVEATIPATVDGEKMRRDLQAKVTAVTQMLHADIPASVEEAADFRSKLQLMIDDIKKTAADITINADADTGAARAKLAVAARTRFADINVRVSKSSLAKAEAQFTRLIGSFSGGAVLGDIGKDLGNGLADLGSNMPRIALLSLAIGGIGIAAVQSVAGILTLTSSLASLAGGLLALPGILAGFGVGVGVMVVALAGAKKQLASLVPVWHQIKATIQDDFWAKARQPILDFVNGVLPQLRAGVGRVASDLGGFAASFSGQFQRAFSGGVLQGMFASLGRSIQIATKAASPLADTVATLGTVGAQYLPRLAGWAADLATKFNAWLQTANKSGHLTDLIDGALTVMHQLAQVTGSVVSILGGLSRAAQAAGSNGLTTIVTALSRVAAVVNTPAFQKGLTGFFSGVSAGAASLGSGIAAVAGAFGALGPALGTVAATLGSALGTALTAIANTLKQPAFATGLTAFFSGIQAGVAALAPVLPALAPMLGQIGQFAGLLAGQLGGVLATAVAALAPIITTLIAQVSPLIPLLGPLLSTAIQAVAPLFTQLATVVLPALMAALMPLLPPIMQLVQQIGSMLAPVLAAIMPVFTALVAAIVPILPPLMRLIQQIGPMLIPVVKAAGKIIAALMPILGALLAAILPIIRAALPPLISLITKLMPVFQGAARIATGILVPAIRGISKILSGLINFLTGVFTGNWRRAWNGIKQIFSGIWNGVIGIAKGALNGVISVINGLIHGVNKITGLVGIPKIPSIPHLAQGGLVSGPTVAMIGEGSYKEAVVPLGGPQFAQLAKALAKAIGVRDGPSTLVVRDVDGALVGRMRIEADRSVQLSNGRLRAQLVNGSRL